MADDTKICAFCKEREGVGTVRLSWSDRGLPLSVAWRICSECSTEKMGDLRSAVEADDDPLWKYTISEGHVTADPRDG